jgi:mannose-6-phosphate isomerase-like protein (cupin superfamily)
MPHLDVHARAVCPRNKEPLSWSQTISVSLPRVAPARSTPQPQLLKEGSMPTTTDDAHSLLAAGEGELIEAAGNSIRIMVASPSQLVCDYSAAPHFPGPPLHVHPGFDETFLVLEGRLQITVEEERRELAPGAAAYMSGLVPHTFCNPTHERARFLVICSPGGFEHYFRAIAAGDHQAIAEISERFGYRAVELSTR